MSRSQVCFLVLCSLLMACISWAQTPMTFIPTGPCRVLDTRTATGPFGGPSLAADAVRQINIPANPACFVPDLATAYVLNVTVVPQGFLGYITLWPDGQTQPFVSTLNSYNGAIKAVSAIVQANTTNSMIDVYTTDPIDLVLDIMGYFVGPGNPDALFYYPLPKLCELVNTVDPPTPNGLGGPALLNGVPRSFQVTNNPNCTIPTEAVAYSLNIIAMPSEGAPMDYLTIWPSDQAQPVASVLNSPHGLAVANGVIVKAGTGSISMYVQGNDADVEVDLNGYFGPKHIGDTLGDALYSFTPCRGMDTRPDEFTNRLDFNLLTQAPTTGLCPNVLPPNTATPPVDAYVLNTTVIPDGEMGYLSIWPYGSPMPVPPTMLAMDGLVTSNMTIVPNGRRNLISAFAGTPIDLVYDVFGYFASPALTILSQMPLPPGTDHVPYGPITMQARGGVPPYTWTGTLPPDLSITAAGVVSGCPLTSTGESDPPTYIEVTDSNSHPSPPAEGNLVINTLPYLAITTPSLPPGTLNTPYSQQLTATGGYGTYTWTLVSGNLPPGFTLSSAGVISGYDGGTRGRYVFTVQVADQECEAPTPPTQRLSITIN
ncbi:MAG TPA: Ig domain-containing protein [Bryocella sp.]|nr:Ig domain-containing protein [Bryocella sp.]